MKRTVVSLLAVSGVLFFATHATAQVFVSNLSPANETPPLDTAMGGLAVASVVVHDDGTSTALIIVSAFANDTPIAASHIHDGPAGVAGPIICPLAGPEFTNPVIASCDFTADQTTDLFNGNLYVNVHTQAHPGGEIRDQLNFVQ
jgi:hypothetical protein